MSRMSSSASNVAPSAMSDHSGQHPLSLPEAKYHLLRIMTRERLTGPNYDIWVQHLRVVLKYENREYVLDRNLPSLFEVHSAEELQAYKKHHDDSLRMTCIMFATMTEELKASFEGLGAYDINQKLQERFHDPVSQDQSFDVRPTVVCEEKRMTSVCTHSRADECYLDGIEDDELAGFVADLIELETSFRNVAPKLFNKSQEDSLPEKDKNVSSTKDNAMKAPPAKRNKASCSHCQKSGHKSMNCPRYLKELRKNKAKGHGTSGS